MVVHYLLSELGGIAISRRPNIRESRENAPGPSAARARAKTIKLIAERLPLNKSRLGTGMTESDSASPPSATINAAKGVIKPPSNNMPKANVDTVIVHTSSPFSGVLK